MTRIFMAGCTALLLLMATGCGNRADQDSLVITGSSTVAPVLAEIATEFENAHPNVRIEIQTGGSSRGIADVKNGKADFGMVSRDLKGSERDFKIYHVASDGIGFVVHTTNPISNLTSDQIRSIFTGKTKNWAELEGKDMQMVVCSKAEGRGTLEVFLKYFGLKPDQIKATLIVGDNQHSLKTIRSNPAAMAYVSIGAAEHAISQGEPIKLVRLDGIMPSTESVKNKTYAMTRPLNLVFRGELTPLQEKFIKSTTSDSSRNLIRAQYFVPVVDDASVRTLKSNQPVHNPPSDSTP